MAQVTTDPGQGEAIWHTEPVNQLFRIALRSNYTTCVCMLVSAAVSTPQALPPHGRCSASALRNCSLKSQPGSSVAAPRYQFSASGLPARRC